jgi:hypothetical protein
MRTDHPLSGRGVVFVTGCGRSGTTAMRSSLSLHPSLLSTNSENNVAGDLLLACHANATMQSRRVSMQVSEEEHNDRFASLILGLLFPRVSDERVDSRRALIASYLTPASAERALDLYPGSRFVCMLRDGVSTIESRMSHFSFGEQPFEAQCDKWADWGHLYRWAEGRDDCIIVRHENLLKDPVGCAERVLRFLRLPEDPRPGELLRSQRFHPTPESERARWEAWSQDMRSYFERVCGETMEQLGYSIPW